MLKKIIKYFKFVKKNNKNEVNVVEEESNAPLPPPPVFIPDELIVEILSLLNVKTIIRFKCVKKSWNTLISDPTFVQKHLKMSSQNPRHIMVVSPLWKYPNIRASFFSVSRLLENPSISTVSGGNNSRTLKGMVVNSCNGLICILFCSHNLKTHSSNYRFCLWNPATKTTSAEFGTFDLHLINPPVCETMCAMLTFGCDILTGTYKIVASLPVRDRRYQVRIHSLGDNCWRNINSFPLSLTPLISEYYRNGLYFSGTVCWLAIREYNFRDYDRTYINNVEQFVIVTLNLSTETYTQFLLPSGFDDVPRYHPALAVLMDHLCFSHDFKGTQLVIWQMKEFGVRESWTQLFRIDLFNLQIHPLVILAGPPLLLPVYLYKNRDILILVCSFGIEAIIYNHRENRVERIRPNSNIVCPFYYTESLVSTQLIESVQPPLKAHWLNMIGKSILNWR